MSTFTLKEDKIKNVVRPVCIGCNKYTWQIPEYIEYGHYFNISPDTYVKNYEGTYNKTNGHFYCTSCFIAAGMPSAPSPKQMIAP